MRSVRLGKNFRAVIIHDAISYLVSEEEIRATVQKIEVEKPKEAAKPEQKTKANTTNKK